MTPGALLSTAAVFAIASLALGRRRPFLWLALVLSAATAGLVSAMWILLGSADWEWSSSFRLGGETLHFRLDGVSAVFLALLGMVGGAGAAYSHEYWSEAEHPASARAGRVWWSALLLSLGFVLVASNGLHFLIGWEAFTVSAYFLITLDRARREVRAAGWLYLAASHAGTVCLFAFFCALAAKTGSWDLGPMKERAELSPLFWLVLLGFGVKAGVFPLHVWLPSAHANAPSHVSAILSGVAVKMGVYGLVRFSGWLPVPPAAGGCVLGLGAIGAAVGIAFAFAQNDLKRLLAYCTVENVGVILAGLGGALFAAAHGDAGWGRLAIAGALLHVWNHGAFKALLFFVAGSVLHATGTREMSRLGGLWRTMPWVAGLFALGAVAVSGLPPLNGFVSEWLVYLGLFDAVTGFGPLAWAAMPAILLLAVAGALALATFLKAGAIVFLGAPRTKAAAESHETNAWMRSSTLTMAAICGAIGLAPLAFARAITRATGSWNPAWASGEIPAPLFALSWAQRALAAIAVFAAIFLWVKVRSRRPRLAPTWDCGFSAPSARMQYTSGSFAGIASVWFKWILRPERKLQRPRGALPARASDMERVPEAVLERVLGPMSAVVLRVSTAVRRLQHGRLQSYLVYLLAGLGVIGALVVGWGNAK